MEKETGERFFLHRCLQHTKTDIKAAAATRGKKTDPEARRTPTKLRNMELLPRVIEWVEFSAWLPNNDEFDVYWCSIF